MKNISLYVIVDNFFKFILLFLFNIIWCSYFISPFYISITIAIGLALIFIIVNNKINGKREIKKLLLLKEEQKIEDIASTFIFMTQNQIVSFFYQLVQTKHTCSQHENHVQIETTTNPILLFPVFKSKALTCDDVLEIYKTIKSKNIKRLIILTSQSDQNLQTITQHFGFETIILNKKETYYKLLKKYEFYPEIKIKNNNKKIKNNLKQILLISLNKKKTKGYLFSSIFLLISSVFVKYKIYYLIFSSLLMFLAFFSYLNPTFNKTQKTNLFE